MLKRVTGKKMTSFNVEDRTMAWDTEVNKSCWQESSCIEECLNNTYMLSHTDQKKNLPPNRWKNLVNLLQMWMPFLHQAAVQEHITVAEDGPLHQLSDLDPIYFAWGMARGWKSISNSKVSTGVLPRVMDNRIGGEKLWLWLCCLKFYCWLYLVLKMNFNRYNQGRIHF